MKNPRFTSYNEYPYDHIVKKSLEKGQITKTDHDLIIKYIKDKLRKGEIEDARAQRISTYLTQWRRFITTPYNEMTYEDLLDGIAAIRKGSTNHGHPYKQSTIRGLIKTIKTYTKWLTKEGVSKITREQLEEIKYPKEVFDSVKSKDILTAEQVELLIGGCRTTRDKAIIAILADTGLRPSDLAGLKWGDIEFNQQRAKLSVVTEKTNESLRCYVILHKSWLVEHRKMHNAANDEDYVFLDNDGRPIGYKAIDRALYRAGTRSGVKFPRGARAKLFRATSITQKQREGYSQSTISKLHFGIDNSTMMRHYSKLNDQDTEREALERSGSVKIEKPEPRRPGLCVNEACGEPLSPGVKFCPACGTPQTLLALSEEQAYQKARASYMKEQMTELEKMRQEISELRALVKK